MSTEIQPTLSPTLFVEPEFTHEEIQVRDAFCKEYLYDSNPIAAAMRIGFMQPFASEFAKKFMNESYVWRKLKELTSAKPDDDADSDREEVQFIKQSLIRESNYHGADSSHGARVQALGKLVNIRGMEAPKKAEVNVNHSMRVMIVPAVASIESWEQQAIESQGELIDASNIS